ncbi:hypothetical protein CsNV_072 [Callinectes sapidus nudivirus]|nr:hypothetical protein CsNV_072 [Callinectes sapidus nudivirus]
MENLRIKLYKLVSLTLEDLSTFKDVYSEAINLLIFKVDELEAVEWVDVLNVMDLSRDLKLLVSNLNYQFKKFTIRYTKKLDRINKIKIVNISDNLFENVNKIIEFRQNLSNGILDKDYKTLFEAYKKVYLTMKNSLELHKKSSAQKISSRKEALTSTSSQIITNGLQGRSDVMSPNEVINLSNSIGMLKASIDLLINSMMDMETDSVNNIEVSRISTEDILSEAEQRKEILSEIPSEYDVEWDDSVIPMSDESQGDNFEVSDRYSEIESVLQNYEDVEPPLQYRDDEFNALLNKIENMFSDFESKIMSKISLRFGNAPSMVSLDRDSVDFAEIKETLNVLKNSISNLNATTLDLSNNMGELNAAMINLPTKVINSINYSFLNEFGDKLSNFSDKIDKLNIPTTEDMLSIQNTIVSKILESLKLQIINEQNVRNLIKEPLDKISNDSILNVKEVVQTITKEFNNYIKNIQSESKAKLDESYNALFAEIKNREDLIRDYMSMLNKVVSTNKASIVEIKEKFQKELDHYANELERQRQLQNEKELNFAHFINYQVPIELKTVIREEAPKVIREVIAETMPQLSKEAIEKVAPEAIIKTLNASVPSILTSVLNGIAPSVIREAVSRMAPEVIRDAIVAQAPAALTGAINAVAPTAIKASLSIIAPNILNSAIKSVAPNTIEKTLKDIAPNLLKSAINDISTSIVDDAIRTLNVNTILDAVKEGAPQILAEVVQNIAPGTIETSLYSIAPDVIRSKLTEIAPKVIKESVDNILESAHSKKLEEITKASNEAIASANKTIPEIIAKSLKDVDKKSTATQSGEASVIKKAMDSATEKMKKSITTQVDKSLKSFNDSSKRNIEEVANKYFKEQTDVTKKTLDDVSNQNAKTLKEITDTSKIIMKDVVAQTTDAKRELTEASKRALVDVTEKTGKSLKLINNATKRSAEESSDAIIKSFKGINEKTLTDMKEFMDESKKTLNATNENVSQVKKLTDSSLKSLTDVTNRSNAALGEISVSANKNVNAANEKLQEISTISFKSINDVSNRANKMFDSFDKRNEAYDRNLSQLSEQHKQQMKSSSDAIKEETTKYLETLIDKSTTSIKNATDDSTATASRLLTDLTDVSKNSIKEAVDASTSTASGLLTDLTTKASTTLSNVKTTAIRDLNRVATKHTKSIAEVTETSNKAIVDLSENSTQSIKTLTDSSERALSNAVETSASNMSQISQNAIGQTNDAMSSAINNLNAVSSQAVQQINNSGMQAAQSVESVKNAAAFSVSENINKMSEYNRDAIQNMEILIDNKMKREFEESDVERDVEKSAKIMKREIQNTLPEIVNREVGSMIDSKIVPAFNTISSAIGTNMSKSLDTAINQTMRDATNKINISAREAMNKLNSTVETSLTEKITPTAANEIVNNLTPLIIQKFEEIVPGTVGSAINEFAPRLIGDTISSYLRNNPPQVQLSEAEEVTKQLLFPIRDHLVAAYRQITTSNENTEKMLKVYEDALQTYSNKFAEILENIKIAEQEQNAMKIAISEERKRLQEKSEQDFEKIKETILKNERTSTIERRKAESKILQMVSNQNKEFEKIKKENKQEVEEMFKQLIQQSYGQMEQLVKDLIGGDVEAFQKIPQILRNIENREIAMADIPRQTDALLRKEKRKMREVEREINRLKYDIGDVVQINKKMMRELGNIKNMILEYSQEAIDEDRAILSAKRRKRAI